MLVLGIDPGLSGALALYDAGTGALELVDVPTFDMAKAGKAKRVVDVATLARTIDAWAKRSPTVWIERVGSMPGQGVASAFDFGCTYGLLIGVCAASFLPMERVTPQVWKKALGLRGGVENKDESRARASALMPRHSHLWPLKKHDGRAEAALIALYGARQAGA